MAITFCRVRHIFRWVHTKKTLDKSIYQELETVPGLECGQDDVAEKNEIEAVSESDIKLTVSALSPMIADMVMLQLRTGARPGELCILRPIDIDRSHDVWVYRPSRQKTQHRGRSRMICIGPEAQRILEPYLTRGADTFCFSPKEAEEFRLSIFQLQAKSPRKTRPDRRRKVSVN